MYRIVFLSSVYQASGICTGNVHWRPRRSGRTSCVLALRAPEDGGKRGEMHARRWRGRSARRHRGVSALSAVRGPLICAHPTTRRRGATQGHAGCARPRPSFRGRARREPAPQWDLPAPASGGDPPDTVPHTVHVAQGARGHAADGMRRVQSTTYSVKCSQDTTRLQPDAPQARAGGIEGRRTRVARVVVECADAH